MFELKTLSKEAISRSLERVERYRLLNEPAVAESICHAILHVEPAHQQALVMLILVTTDQFAIKPVWLALPQQSGGASSFGVSSYRSALVRAGHPEDAIRQLDANTVLSFEFQPAAGPRSAPTNFRRARRHAPVQWDVRQHKTTTDDWERAFEAAVAKRVRGALRRACAARA